jgi:hypothetical protein
MHLRLLPHDIIITYSTTLQSILNFWICLWLAMVIPDIIPWSTLSSPTLWHAKISDSNLFVSKMHHLMYFLMSWYAYFVGSSCWNICDHVLVYLCTYLDFFLYFFMSWCAYFVGSFCWNIHQVKNKKLGQLGMLIQETRRLSPVSFRGFFDLIFLTSNHYCPFTLVHQRYGTGWMILHMW